MLSGVVAGMALLPFVFSACSKYADNSNSQTSTSNLAVIDVSPSAPSLDFYLDGARVNSSAITYGGGLEYFTCYAGNRHATFYQSGSTTAVASDTAALQPNAAYTMVLSNLPSTPDITVFRDSIYAPASSAATIRLINASPDAGAVDFGVKGKSLLGSNIAYRKATPFVSVSLVTSLTDTLQIYHTGTNTVLQTIPVQMVQGGVYTIYLYGFQSQTSSAEKLGSGVMENTYYY